MNTLCTQKSAFILPICQATCFQMIQSPNSWLPLNTVRQALYLLMAMTTTTFSSIIWSVSICCVYHPFMPHMECCTHKALTLIPSVGIAHISYIIPLAVTFMSVIIPASFWKSKSWAAACDDLVQVADIVKKLVRSFFKLLAVILKESHKNVGQHGCTSPKYNWHLSLSWCCLKISLFPTKIMLESQDFSLHFVHVT